MKERMQKTSAFANDCPQRDRTESEWIHGDGNRHELSLNGDGNHHELFPNVGVQTFMWMTEDNIVEVLLSDVSKSSSRSTYWK